METFSSAAASGSSRSSLRGDVPSSDPRKTAEDEERTREQAASLLLRLSYQDAPQPRERAAQLGDRPPYGDKFGSVETNAHAAEGFKVGDELPNPSSFILKKKMGKEDEETGEDDIANSGKTVTVPMSINFLLNSSSSSSSRSPSPPSPATTTSTSTSTSRGVRSSPPSPSNKLMDSEESGSARSAPVGRLSSGRRSPPPLPSLQLPLVFPEVAHLQKNGHHHHPYGLPTTLPPFMGSPSSPPAPLDYSSSSSLSRSCPAPSPPPLSPGTSCSSPASTSLFTPASQSPSTYLPPLLARSTGGYGSSGSDARIRASSDELHSLLAPVFSQASAAAGTDYSPHASASGSVASVGPSSSQQQDSSASSSSAGPRPAASSMMREEDGLRLKREVHLQRQRKLLLQLLQEKQKEIEGKWGADILPTADVDGFVVDDGVLVPSPPATTVRPRIVGTEKSEAMVMDDHPVVSAPLRGAVTLPPGVTIRRNRDVPSYADGNELDGMDGMDGLENVEAELAKRIWADQRRQQLQRGPRLQREESVCRAGNGHTRGYWTGYRERLPEDCYEMTSPAGHPERRARTESLRGGVVDDHRSALSKHRPQSSLNELEDEDSYDEATSTTLSPPSSTQETGLKRLYGGSNQSRAQDDSLRRRRRPGHYGKQMPSEDQLTGATAHHPSDEKQARAYAWEPAHNVPISEHATHDGKEPEADGWWRNDTLSSRYYRSALSPPRLSPAFQSLYLQARGQRAGEEQAGISPPRDDSREPRILDTTKNIARERTGDSDASSCIATVVAPATIGASAPEDNSARKRASPEQMQMLQKILSFYEQSPKRIEELERNATSIPIRRRKRRSESGPASSASPKEAAAAQPADVPTTASGVDGGVDGAVKAEQNTSSSASSASGQPRKRRKRDPEVLIFHHMKVQDDGKMMMVQRT